MNSQTDRRVMLQQETKQYNNDSQNSIQEMYIEQKEQGSNQLKSHFKQKFQKYQPYIVFAVIFFVLLVIRTSMQDSTTPQQIDTHNKNEDFDKSISQLKQNILSGCPHQKIQQRIRQGIFYLKSQLNQLNQSEEILHKNIAEKCKFSILTNEDLQNYINKWNENKEFTQIPNDWKTKFDVKEKRLLLIFLRFYFYEGSYFHSTQEIDNIQDRCLIFSHIGFQILFTDYKQIKSDDIYIPEDKFTYSQVGQKSSEMVKNVIINILQVKNPFQMCQTKQCLIIPCKIK